MRWSGIGGCLGRWRWRRLRCWCKRPAVEKLWGACRFAHLEEHASVSPYRGDGETGSFESGLEVAAGSGWHDCHKPIVAGDEVIVLIEVCGKPSLFEHQGC